MNIFGLHITTSKVIAAARAFAGNELDNAIVAAKKTELGQGAVAAVQAAEQPGLIGEQKMEHAIAALAPTVISYIARGGFSAVVADVETFARSLLESTLADVRKTTAGQVATAVLAVAAAA